MSALLSVVLAGARAYLNDTNASIWTDTALIPLAQEAHRELQSELWQIGSPLVRSQSAPTLVALSATPTDLTTGLLAPADLLVPTSLQESALAAGPYIPMTEANYFPLGYVATATLVYWMWQKEHLWVAPCTAARYVVIQYRNLITIPTLATSDIGVLFGEMYLSPRTAALALGTVKEFDTAKVLSDVAMTNFGKLVSANRGQQKPSAKP